MTLDNFQSFGTTHSVKDLLNIKAIGSESSADSSRSVRGPILSGPDAPCFRILILPATIAGVTTTDDKGGPKAGSMFGGRNRG